VVNLWSSLATHAERTPEKELLRYKDAHQTYAEFSRDALRAASALRELGVHRDENVCALLGNSQIVNAHPAVMESAAVGVPSEFGEEEVKVCVVLRPGDVLEPAALVAWCEERMAYFMVPRYVEFRDALPKTATERVEKYKLKQEGIGAAWDRTTGLAWRAGDQQASASAGG